jgi:hypothetical protein
MVFDNLFTYLFFGHRMMCKPGLTGLRGSYAPVMYMERLYIVERIDWLIDWLGFYAVLAIFHAASYITAIE